MLSLAALLTGAPQAHAQGQSLHVRLGLQAPWTLVAHDAWTLNGKPMDPGTYRIIPDHSGLSIQSSDQTYGACLPAPLRASGDLLAINGHRYRGSLLIRSTSVVNEVGVQQYLYSVVAKEIGGNAEPEALKAQAVVARTYVTAHLDGHELSDDTSFQVYSGADGETAASRAAVDATDGQVLAWQGKLARHVCYHSTCGGATEANENVFLSRPIPYLRGVACQVEGSAAPSAGQQSVAHDGGAAAVATEPPAWTTSTASSGGPLPTVESAGTSAVATASPAVPVADSSLIAAMDYRERHLRGYGLRASRSGHRSPTLAIASRTSRSRSPLEAGLASLVPTQRKASAALPGTSGGGSSEGSSGARACSASSYADWNVVIEGEAGRTAHILERTPGGRVLRLRVGSHTYAGDDIRRALRFRSKDGRSLPLYSTCFELVSEGGVLHARGHGWGHGVGLCQWGARGLARRGVDYSGILTHYFPQTQLQRQEEATASRP